jgi:TonB family protein
MMTRWILASLLWASALSAQSAPPKAATLSWSDLRILIAPEAGETMLWLSADASLTKKGGARNFFGALDPAETLAWVQSSREFLKRSFSSRDTGDARASAVLQTKRGEEIFLVRRRFKGNWTHERFLAFADSTDKSPALLDIDPFRTRDLLDSLEAVASRTPASMDAAVLAKPVWIGYRNLRVAIAPDSGGTYLWVNTGELSSKQTETFSGSFDPAMVLPWADSARALLSKRFPSTDTGTFRASRRLSSFGGDRIHVERQRVNGAWSQDRFVVMEPKGGEPFVIKGDETVIGMIVDSLAAVSRRTPIVNAVVQRDSAEQANTLPPTKPATARPDNVPPMYPEVERGVRRSGTVLVSFVVGIDGMADTTSVKVIHASSFGFRKAVLDALPALKFFPAERDGTTVRARVVMPFTFSVVR